MSFFVGIIALFGNNNIKGEDMEKRLNALLRLALKYKATDIHFTKQGYDMTIEMRIDDVIRKVKTVNGDERMIRYLQYLANLDVANLTKPQTGQFEWQIDNKVLSLRFALIHNPKMDNGVLRILSDEVRVELHNLSINEKQNEFFKQIINYRSGLFITSGPTGSGKTTTLYAMLKGIKHRKIFTIEDPIEIHTDDFIQININEQINFGYDEAIKQVLRHDPDVIMIGEIRDEITAKMAIRAANTGHLVISTLHAPSCILAIERMLELGVNKGQLMNVLIGLSNQRLFTKNHSNQKLVLYETMNRDDITYYFNNQKLDHNFYSLKRGINDAIKAGLLEVEQANRELI